MADEKKRDWIDIVAKLLVPVALFAVGSYFTIKKNEADIASQQFQRESEILKLTASSNETEKAIGLKMIQLLQERGEKIPDALRPVVSVTAEGRPSDPSTQKARNIQAVEAKQDQPSDTHSAPPAKNQATIIYLQIAREDQRAEATELQEGLQHAGFSVPGIELVKPPTVNTYIRYFSVDDKPQADKALKLMKDMKFSVEEQNFTRLNENNTSTGQLEVWIGDKHIAPSRP
jgi:hypothetical protein